MSHFKPNTSDAPKDLNSIQQSVTTMDNISEDLLASQSSDQLPITTNNITEDVITDDIVAETNKDDLLNDIVDLTMDSDIITLDDSLSINETVQSTYEGPIINLDEFYDVIDILSDKSDSDNTPETISNLLKGDEVITLDDIFDPIIESVCKDRENEKSNKSQTANTDICDTIESSCNANVNEKPIEKPTANMVNDCPTIENGCKTTNDSSEKTEIVNTTKDDTINVQENITDNDEICCSQAALKGFDIQDFEEQIELFKIPQNDYAIPQNQLVEEEELTRYIVEIGNESEIPLNVILEPPSRLDTTENKDVLESNKLPVEESKINEVIYIKTLDLNNDELEFSLKDEIPLCTLINAEQSLTTNDNNDLEDSDSDYCAGYHSSDFEFISEGEAEAERGLYFKSKSKKKTLKLSTIDSETPSTSKNVVPSTANDKNLKRNYSINSETPSISKDTVVPSTANDNNLKQNYSSLNVQFPTSEETRKRENCETIQDQNKNGAMPSTSNNIQERDYRSLRLKFLADEEKRMRENHKTPQGQEYLDLFGGPNAPIANDLFILENKSVKSRAWCMDIYYEGVGFDARYNMPQEEVSEDDKKAAEETTKKIQEMYPWQNRTRRRRF